jgi:hypothetical protein
LVLARLPLKVKLLLEDMVTDGPPVNCRVRVTDVPAASPFTDPPTVALDELLPPQLPNSKANAKLPTHAITLVRFIILPGYSIGHMARPPHSHCHRHRRFDNKARPQHSESRQNLKDTIKSGN